MTPLQRGLALALAQLALVASLGAKLLHDRATYPRAWARVAPIDPALPLRGRYVELRLIPHGLPQEPAPSIAGIDLFTRAPRLHYSPVTLRVRDGQLVAVPDPDGDKPLGRSETYYWDNGPQSWLGPPLLFFLPEHVPDPSQRKPGEELWVEVTVPPKGPPRPLRLGVRTGTGPIQPQD